MLPALVLSESGSYESRYMDLNKEASLGLVSVNTLFYVFRYHIFRPKVST